MMPTRRLLRFILFFALVVSGATNAAHSTAWAQAAHETATARALFKEGVAFADQGDWQSAEDRFRRAHSLRPSPVIAFNWVSALEQLGRLLEASELARRITNDPEADRGLVRAAEDKLSAMEPRLAGITVQVSGETENVMVSLDDHELPRAAWGVETPADPGEHRAEAKREGETVSEATVTLAEGEKAVLSLEVLPPPEPEPVAAAAPPPVEEPERKSWVKNPWMWAGIGAAVVVGAVVGGAMAAGGGTQSPPEGNAKPGLLTF